MAGLIMEMGLNQRLECMHEFKNIPLQFALYDGG